MNAINNRKRVLVDDSLRAAGWAMLESRPDVEAISYSTAISKEAFQALLPGAHGIALDLNRFGPAELAVADEMQVVGRIGVGYDIVDVPACTEKGVLLMTTGTANSVSVAEQTMSLMLELARHPADYQAMVRGGRWSERLVNLPIELFQQTILVVGFGRIGTRIALRCRGMEMKVLVCDPYVDAAHIIDAGCEPVTLAEGLPRADFITVHCPRNAETTGMIGKTQLASTKWGAFVINTARGGIVDELALHDALVSGHLGGAGLDVFVQEPVPTDHPLLALPNVVVAPHVAGCTLQGMDRLSCATIANILSVFDGEPILENVINKEVLR